MTVRVQPFSLPKDGDVFINQIIERCEGLIYAGIWEGLDTIRLHTWMNNFNTPTERYFAACVLDALIYRSRAQTVAMMRQLFQRSLPDILRTEPPNVNTETDWYQQLQLPMYIKDAHIRIIPVIRSMDPPSKSGPLICRIYRRELMLNQKLMIWPWQIDFAKSVGVNAFLFVDDFLGTGEQFSNFMKHFAISNKLSNMDAIYAPLVGHEDGIKCLQNSYPELRICAVEILDKRHSLFAKNSLWFQDENNTNDPMSARLFYNKLVKDRNLPVSGCETGVGDLGIAYGFEHATPDNCLPILWIRTDNWEPLLER